METIKMRTTTRRKSEMHDGGEDKKGIERWRQDGTENINDEEVGDDAKED